MLRGIGYVSQRGGGGNLRVLGWWDVVGWKVWDNSERLARPLIRLKSWAGGTIMKENHAHRLMVLELAVGRARWFGAALAALIAYLAGGQVVDAAVVAFVTVGVVLAGAFLLLYVLLYERATLRVKWLFECGLVDRNDEVDGEICSRPVLAGIFAYC